MIDGKWMVDPKKKACGHQQSFPIPSASHTHPRQPLIHFLLLWSLFNWTHTLCGLVQRSPFTLHSVFKVHLLCILYQYFGEGNDTPLQYSCLENPMDGGAWSPSASSGRPGNRLGMQPWALSLPDPAERLLWPGRASPSAPQLLAFSPGKEQAAGVWSQ